MGDYSYSELMKMQNDAIKRVEDMQRKARQSAGLEGEKPVTRKQVVKEEPRRIPMPDDYLDNLKAMAAHSAESEDGKKEKREKNEKPPAQSGGFLGDFNFDSDTALILSLILLLSQEKADETLIMALLYMLT